VSVARPPSAPPRVWLVLLPSGERHLLVKEPLEGIEVWARGQKITVLRYDLAAVVHTPPPEKRK
jgi:hypothetical protein